MATYSYIQSSGTVIVDTAFIKNEVEQEWLLVSGATDIPDPASVEGRQLDAEITSRVSVAQNNALLANQINPDLSTGTFFDAIYKLMGGERDAAERSTVDMELTGVPGTTIFAGSFAQDENDNLWFCVSDTTIAPSGTVTVSFRSVEFGPIDALPNTINQIVTTTLGWETANNPAAPVVGKFEQSIVDAKYQRLVELGANSKSAAYSVIAAVSQLEGVEGVAFRENYENTTEVIDGITMPPKSTWLCVDGGALSEISAAYVINRFGTAFYGFSNTEAGAYTDPYSGQDYIPLIDRPTDIPVKVRVTTRISATTNPVEEIKDAVIEYSSGSVEGYVGFRLGADVSPFEIGGALNQSLSPSRIYIVKCEVTTVANDTYVTDTLPINLWEKASVTDANIEVVIV